MRDDVCVVEVGTSWDAAQEFLVWLSWWISDPWGDTARQSQARWKSGETTDV